MSQSVQPEVPNRRSRHKQVTFTLRLRVLCYILKQEQTEVDHQESRLHWIVWGLILPIDLAHRSCPLILPIDLAHWPCPFDQLPLHSYTEHACREWGRGSGQWSSRFGDWRTILQWRWDWTIKILNRCRPYRWMDLTRARQFWTWGWWS